jgi:hypothetical protein
VVDWLHVLFGVTVLHWVGNLWNYWGICNMWRLRRVCYLWRWRMMWMVSCGVMVRLIVCRKWSLIGLVGLWCKKRRIGWRVLLMVRVPLHCVVNFSGCRFLQSFCVVLIHFLF